MTLRLNCWCGPRNMSTAFMYSWRERSDTSVVDEPFYAHFLQATGRDHPDRDLVLASLDPDSARVIRDVILGPYDSPVVFFKQMGHHMVDVDLSFLGSCRNMFLTRHPRDMLASLVKIVPDAQLADTGLENQVRILDAVLATGETPVVVDSGILLADPPGLLAELCATLGLDFEPAMLAWPAGPKPEDGVWAPHWYESVHRTTGFEARRPRSEPLPERLEPVLAEAIPLYERLAAFAVGI